MPHVVLLVPEAHISTKLNMQIEFVLDMFTQMLIRNTIREMEKGAKHFVIPTMLHAAMEDVDAGPNLGHIWVSEESIRVSFPALRRFTLPFSPKHLEQAITGPFPRSDWNRFGHDGLFAMEADLFAVIANSPGYGAEERLQFGRALGNDYYTAVTEHAFETSPPPFKIKREHVAGIANKVALPDFLEGTAASRELLKTILVPLNS